MRFLDLTVVAGLVITLVACDTKCVDEDRYDGRSRFSVESNRDKAYGMVLGKYQRHRWHHLRCSLSARHKYGMGRGGSAQRPHLV
jgi:hypothetical protein